MRFKVINTSLLLNGKLLPEGSTIELSKEETEGIETYLHPSVEKPVPNLVRDTNSNKKLNNKKEKIK